MSRTPSISANLAEFNDTDALKQAKAVYNALKANPIYFPTPDVALTDFLAAITDFDTKLTACTKGTPLDTANKNAARIVLNNIYSVEGHYVTRVSKGNLVMLRASKFVMAKEPETPVNPDL